MFRYFLRGGDPKTYLVSLLLTLPIMLLSLSVHETAHGFVAHLLGDPTAERQGRLSLNPMKHLNLFGFLCMLLTGFGWANPVPVDSRYFKKPRRDVTLVALAGPVSNLLLAVLFLLLLRFLGLGVLVTIPIKTEFQFHLIEATILLFYYGVSMNVTLAVFNLLPVPPLDGSRVLHLILPPKAYLFVMRYERIITLVFMALLLLGPLSFLISFVTDLILKGLFALVGIGGLL